MGRRIGVAVKPKARNAELVQIAQDEYRISVGEPAQNGQANEAVISLLADHLGIPKSKLKIVRGISSRHKLIEITS
jgi:uncharacterized protein YggU (UPF0235/DUF167 family)